MHGLQASYSWAPILLHSMFIMLHWWPILSNKHIPRTDFNMIACRVDASVRKILKFTRCCCYPSSDPRGSLRVSLPQRRCDSFEQFSKCSINRCVTLVKKSLISR
jgi:hypothetical protein